MQGQPVFLRSSLIRLRSWTSDHCAILHPGSGALIATDRLGYRALGRLLAGSSIQAVARWLDAVAPGAGARLPLLEDALAAVGALSETAPRRGMRWWLRRGAAQAIGFAVSLCTVVVPYLPLDLLAALFHWLPRAVLARHMRKQSSWYLEYVLNGSGYATRPPAWRADVAQQICVASMRTYLLVLLAVLLPPARARALLDRLVTVRGGAALAAAPRGAGAVVACVHGDSFSALLLYHALHAQDAACVVRPWMANTTMNTAQRGGGWLESYLGRLIPAQHASAGRALIRHVRAGGLALVPFDTTPLAPDHAPTITFLGRSALANEGPAWLAVHTGAPLIMATTRYEAGRIILEYKELLPARAQHAAQPAVAALTARLYRLAESTIRANPGGWLGWTFIEQFLAPAPDYPAPESAHAMERDDAAAPALRPAATLAGEVGAR
jgi:lauroyl/myristoyl acyltransferase